MTTKTDREQSKDNRSAWGFVVGVAGFCLLLALHLTAFGIVFVAAVVAAVVFALYRF